MGTIQQCDIQLLLNLMALFGHLNVGDYFLL